MDSVYFSDSEIVFKLVGGYADNADSSSKFSELGEGLEFGEELWEEEVEEEEKKKTLNQEVVEYFIDRRVNDLFEFMMNHLIVNEPDDPVVFLQQLMDKCLVFRAGRLADLPSVFEEHHVSAMFDAFDSLGRGTVPLHMYHKAMEILKLDYYEQSPETEENGEISKENFIHYVTTAQKKELLDIILLPPVKETGYIYPLGKTDPWRAQNYKP